MLIVVIAMDDIARINQAYYCILVWFNCVNCKLLTICRIELQVTFINHCPFHSLIHAGFMSYKTSNYSSSLNDRLKSKTCHAVRAQCKLSFRHFVLFLC